MHSTCSGAAELPSTEQFLDQSSLKKNFGLLFFLFFLMSGIKEGEDLKTLQSVFKACVCVCVAPVFQVCFSKIFENQYLG